MVAGRRPQAVLFTCRQNAIRSPMAEGLTRHFFGRSLYIASAGVLPGLLDPFAVAAMDEIGIDIAKHRPKTVQELEDWEGLNFDLVVSLAPEAHHQALELTRTLAIDVAYWPTVDPSLAGGNREQRLDAYRAVRDSLSERILAEFGSPALVAAT